MSEERAATGLDGPPETHDADPSKSAKKVTSEPSITAKPRIPVRLGHTPGLSDTLGDLGL
eukprot:6130043-Pyramimonas_sp.AAC.1